MISCTLRSRLVSVLPFALLVGLSPGAGAASDKTPAAAAPRAGQPLLPGGKSPVSDLLKRTRSKLGPGRGAPDARDPRRARGGTQGPGAAKSPRDGAPRPVRPGPAARVRQLHKGEAAPVGQLKRKGTAGNQLRLDRLLPSHGAGRPTGPVGRVRTPRGAPSKVEPGGKNVPAVGKGFLPRAFRDKPGGPATGTSGRPGGTFRKSDRPIGASLPVPKLIEKIDGLRGRGGFGAGLMAIQSIKVDRGPLVPVGRGCLRVDGDRNLMVLNGLGFGGAPGTVTVALGAAPQLHREGTGRLIRVMVMAWSDTSIKLTTGTIYPRTGEGTPPTSQALRFIVERREGGAAVAVVPICPERRVVELALAGLFRGFPSRDDREFPCRSESGRRFDVGVHVTWGPEPWSDPRSVVARATVAITTASDSPDPSVRRRWSGRARLSLPVRWFGRELKRYSVFILCGDSFSGALPVPSVRLSFGEVEWYKRVFVRLYSRRDTRAATWSDVKDERPPVVEGAAPLYIREIRVLNEEIPRGLFPGIVVRVDRLTDQPLPGVTTTHFVEIQRTDEGLPPTRALRLPLQPGPGGGWQAVLDPERARRLYATGVAVDWGAQLEVRLARAGRSAGTPIVLERRRVRIPESTRWNVEVRLKEVRVRESGDDDLTRGDGDWEQVLLHLGRCMEEADFGTTQVPDGAVLRPVRPVRCAVRGVTLPQRGMVTVYEDDGSATMRLLATAFGRFAIPDPSVPTRSPLNNFRVRVRGRGLDADAFLEVALRRSLPRTVLFSR